MEEMKELMDRIDAMSHEIDRLQAVVDIQNVMGRYEAVLTPFSMERVVPECFAYWMDDVSMEVSGLGVFRGREALTYLMTVIMGPQNEPSLCGAMYLHHINTPMIQVAEDGKTAHAVWFSSGVESPFNRETGRRQAKWCWGKYSAELIKGECGWRIWHLHWFREFMNDYYKSWVDDPDLNPDNSVGVGRFPGVNVEPTTFHAPYSPDREMLPVPLPPDPYTTHENSDWIMGKWAKEQEHPCR